MAGFTLSVFGLLLFLWIAFGGVLPLKPEGYRFKVAFPEATALVEEADVRMAGINIGKVKGKELSDGGRRTIAEIEVDDRFGPIPRDTRAILRQKSLLGETYIALSPGDKDAGDLPDGGTLARSQVERTTELDEIFGIFDERTRGNFQAWLHESGIAASGEYGSDLNAALGNAAPFFEDGADVLRPLDEQELALRRLVRNTGRVFSGVSADEGRLRRLIVGGEATFSALASRDEALTDSFRVLPTFLRETRTTVRRLERFAGNTDPLVRDLREPAIDLGPTLRDLGDLAPDLERLFRNVDPLVTASRSGVPAAERFVSGAEPLLESVHAFMPELNPTLAYLNFARGQIGTFLSAPSATLSGNGDGGYPRDSATEHYLPQSAIIDTRSLMRRPDRPFWDRGNAYVSPNAYLRAISLGVIENFDCRPNGGEQSNPSGTGVGAEPPCFEAPPLLFQNQKYPRLRRGAAPLVPAPKGREGTQPATP
jgi:phospholipid/cholesterol/gamma-HCH transport system substrate-binding protein